MMRGWWPTAAGLALAGCAEPLAPGQWGVFRYFGQVEGEPPMDLLPPLADRDGHVYVLHGNRDQAENAVYVGDPAGGWSGGCSAHRGSFGMHGFVGRGRSEAWFWAGHALVEVDGRTGACREVLSKDPVTGTEIAWRAVVPWMDETPSHRWMYGLVQGAADPLPFWVVLDLDTRRYQDPVPFADADMVVDGTEVVVVGTGVDEERREGVVVVSYTTAQGPVTEAVRLGRDGPVRADRLQVDALGEAAVHGFIAFDAGGVGAGLLEGGDLLVLSGASGGVVAVEELEAHGVVAWDGQLYVTGLRDGRPAVARLVDGNPQSVTPFDAAEAAAAAIAGGVVVRDERSDPARDATWSEAQSAIGPAPLISPWPLDRYTLDSAGWLLAGPFYENADVRFTAVAFAPVGVSFP